ncbi:hypothetical protein AUQ37_05470 [Candidatus Methanomethylophilus sp. 1R26]|nr:hypothetical protein AUQ37_05470 [Candidatus Methanomethylophilus sp. 1R26]
MVALLWISLKYAGTVTTAPATWRPRLFSASSTRRLSSMAERSSAVYCFPMYSKIGSVSPIWRLKNAATAPLPSDCISLALSPIAVSPPSKHITLGVISFPSPFGTISAFEVMASNTATAQ